MEAAVVAAAVVMLLPRLKAKPPTELLAVVTETAAVGLPAAKLGGCSEIALWSGKMPSILLSLFLCSLYEVRIGSSRVKLLSLQKLMWNVLFFCFIATKTC